MRILLIFYFLFILILAVLIAYLVSKMQVRHPLRMIIFTLILIASPVILSYIALTYWAPLPETIVPEVIGLSEPEAKMRLEQLGLRLMVENRYQENGPVTFQRPEAGRLVKEGRTVFAIIGKPENIHVTDQPPPYTLGPLTPETITISPSREEKSEGEELP